MMCILFKYNVVDRSYIQIMIALYFSVCPDYLLIGDLWTYAILSLKYHNYISSGLVSSHMTGPSLIYSKT